MRFLAVALALVIPGLALASGSVISERLARNLAEPAGSFADDDGVYGVWVKFNDRHLTDGEMSAALVEVRGRISTRSLARRAKAVQMGAPLVSASDLPVSPEYIDAVLATGVEFRRESRWLNAVSVNATAEQIEALGALPFVAGVDLVGRFRSHEPELSDDDKARIEEFKAGKTADKNLRWSLDYGGSLEQAELINLPPVHQFGLMGSGVVIGVMDTGFDITHESLQQANVLATYDFINDKTDVSTGPGDPDGQSRHGSELLCLLAGFKEGALIGVAPQASYILAKTEELDREDPSEEDNFIAALEWMESLGVDVVSSQVGYVDWYRYQDLDGMTAAITIACDMASMLGVCVVTAVGDLNGEPGLPPMMAPADGRHVITVGSVLLNGQVYAGSSRGPTYDGRIKPDVMALGVGPVGGSWYADWLYPYLSGTSTATAQVAGVVALMLERLPDLSPWQVREALRMTASQADYPDNNYGWGIVNAKRALEYWGPVIDHEPLVTTDASTPRQVSARVTGRQGIDPQSVVLSYRVDSGTWKRIHMAASGNDNYAGNLPAAPSGSVVEYYIEAVDLGGLGLTLPWAGNLGPFAYEVGSDLVAPDLDHHYLMDQRLVDWPPQVRAYATDNTGVASVDLYYAVDGGSEQGPFPLGITEDYFALDFPLAAGSLATGSVVSYRLTATDMSSNANLTEIGPFAFDIVAQRARVLVIDDLSETKALNGEAGRGPVGDGSAGGDKSFLSPVLIAGWLSDAGYQVDTIISNQVKEGSFNGYSVVVLSSGLTFNPIGTDELRAQMIAFEGRGGKILVEGGETAYVAGLSPTYPDFFANVLHAGEVIGEGGYIFHPTPGMEHHAFLGRPNLLPNELNFGLLPGQVDYRVSDVVQPDAESGVVYSSSFAVNSGGVLFHDNNTGPDQGQVVFFPFAINFLKDAVGRMLVENALAYLLIEEQPGRSAVSGQVQLADRTDHSGITVMTDSLHVTQTDAEGNYFLDGLWGGPVTLVATFPGYGTESLEFELADDQVYAADPLILTPSLVLEYENTTSTPIPDNDPAGVELPIDVTGSGSIHTMRVTVDISHYSINNLIVRLTSPAGTIVTLHNRTGGTADNIVGSYPDELVVDGPGSLTDFQGEQIQGIWVLSVSDNAFGAVGTVNSWGLTLEVTGGAPVPSGVTPDAVTRILGNVPNPFNPQTVIAYELARPGRVNLNVYDLRGRLVRTLVDGDMPEGRHEVTWDGRDGAGQGAASGMYFTKLVAGEATQVSKMTLVR